MHSKTGQDGTKPSHQATAAVHSQSAQQQQYVPKHLQQQQSEESKQGSAPAGKKHNSNVSKTDTKAKEESPPLRLLVHAETNASFFYVKKDGENHSLEKDPALPSFPLATVARFAPKKGKQAVVQDVYGLHFIDTELCCETLMLANSDYTHLEYSPDDTYIMAVSKFNLQQPNKNLHLILAASG